VETLGGAGTGEARPFLRRLKRSLWPLGVAGVLGLLLVYPVGLLFVRAFQIHEYGQAPVWTLRHFRLAFTSPDLAGALGNTLLTSVGGALFATGMGTTLGWIVARTDVPGRGILGVLNLIPFFLSSLIGAASWQILGAPRTGLINTTLASVLPLSGPVFNIFSRFGIALVIGLFYAPFVYLFTLGAFRNMDPALEEAARMSGAATLGTALRVTMPLALPAILSGGLLVVVSSAGLFGVPLLLGRPGRVHTLATRIYQATQDYPPDYSLAAALSVVLLLLTMLLLFLERRFVRGRAFTTVTGKGYRPATIRLGRWRGVALGMNLLYLAAVFVPLLVLLLVSFQRQWVGEFQMRQATLSNYAYIFFTEATAMRGLRNSLFLSAVGATLGLAGCGLVAYLVQRTRLPGLGLIEAVAMLPVTLPGVVLGVGFFIAWVGTPLYGTIWALMLAYIIHYFPLGVKSTGSVLLSVGPELEESGWMSGASRGQTLRRVTLPLLRPGLTATWLLLFVTYMREVGASIILFLPGLETLSVALIRIMEYEAFGITAAFAVVQTVLLLGVAWVFNRMVGIGSLSV
jgi:iron(III) transport system permease protein